MKRAALLSATLAAAAISASCTDPVVDDAIEALGEEPGFYLNEDGKRVQTDASEFHRQGDPCVLCHSSAGNASSKFLFAGTVFQLKADRKAADKVEILLVDAAGRVPTKPIVTNKAGNFIVREEDWPDFSGFPVRTALFREDVGQTQMITHIGREPSCAGCHRDPKKGVKDDKLSALGHVFLNK